METVISNILRNRVLLLDGAMGTMIQKYRLDESAYRGNLQTDFHTRVAGNNELLTFSQPDIIREIHTAYLQAGADIIETNTFSANAISQATYGLQNYCFEMNRQAALLAKACCRTFTRQDPAKPRFVAGSMGPTDKALSLSGLSENERDQGNAFDKMSEAYYWQAMGLIKGGADLLLLETIIDTLNAKAAIAGIHQAFRQSRKKLPLMISLSLSGTAGRVLSGQNLEAVYYSLLHARPLSFGLNCSFGAADMLPWLEQLSGIATCHVSAHPNAGLPDELGHYCQTPEPMLKEAEPFLQKGLVNIIGGCCGTTPEHISAMAGLLPGHSMRKPVKVRSELVLCSMEAFHTEEKPGPIVIGEKTNVAGSRAFANAIEKGDISAALSVARKQAEAGAAILDVCMDGISVNSQEAMTHFLNGISADAQLARIPLMIDSSDFQLIQMALKLIQGKAIVNSISLKNGEKDFLSKAGWLQTMGAAAVIMLFDEQGQATSYERRISIARRSYSLLKGIGFPQEDIIFDPNVLAIGTGMDEHNDYAVAFIQACRWIKQNLPQAKVSAGVSNLSFAFRGHKPARTAIHASFIHHATAAGLDFIIADPENQGYDQADQELRQLADELVMNRSEHATENMLTYCRQHPVKKKHSRIASDKTAHANESDIAEGQALTRALTLGQDDKLLSILQDLIKQGLSPLEIIEGHLADAMQELGQEFAEGRVYLPQLIRSAQLMKKAVHFLDPGAAVSTGEKTGKKNKIILATVKGDVHDIGKNIVGIVLACNGFEIIDLGVMVPPGRIAEAIQRHKPKLLGLSGLISPSLDEMIHTLEHLNKNNIHTPVLIGGASTSPLHTALKMAPVYNGPVVHVRDASAAATAAMQLTQQKKHKAYIAEVREQQRKLTELYRQKESDNKDKAPIAKTLSGLRMKNHKLSAPPPLKPGIHFFESYPLQNLIPYINWTGLFHAWQIRGNKESIGQHPLKRANADLLLAKAREMLDRIILENTVSARGAIGIFEAFSEKQHLVLVHQGKEHTFFMPDRIKTGLMGYPVSSFTDFVSRKGSGFSDYAGVFALSAGFGTKEMAESYRAKDDDFSALLIETLAGRLTEAFCEHMHERVRKEFWGYAPDEKASVEELLKGTCQGIRPAPGYPGWTDHSAKQTLLQLIDPLRQTGISLTETFSLIPSASTTGLYLWTPKMQ